jgi:hypothetical protein
MEEKLLNFKVGDWVILEESYLHNKRSRNIKRTNKILDMFSYPQQIRAIYQKKEWPSRRLFEFSSGKEWRLYENEFRLATDKEIKEQQIKNLFVNKE